MCPQCGTAFPPWISNSRLPGKLTPQVQGWLVRLGAWLPFARAADLLADLTQVPMSEATARRATLAAGAGYVVHQTHEAAQILHADPNPRRRPTAWS